MNTIRKPYIIVPHLIPQPTWGGSYIAEKKEWQDKRGAGDKKIGQSYELFSGTKLAADISSTDEEGFGPDYANTIGVLAFAERRPFPLIKFTQAKGNSFQLHVKPSEKNTSWKPKAESWYFFEPGKITFGVKSGASIEEYKKTCQSIEAEMEKISALVKAGTLTLGAAQARAKDFIAQKNPWQFVNVHKTNAGDVVDLSGGGLHHSWEEDADHCPMGNILYEIQQDVMDPVSTLRSFDQGKIMDDGSIRAINVDDYFKYLDTDGDRNTLRIEKNREGKLFDTPYYSLDLLEVASSQKMEAATSFHHLFVNKGKITVSDRANSITVGTGHSCFVPKGISYEISAGTESELLLTYLK